MIGARLWCGAAAVWCVLLIAWSGGVHAQSTPSQSTNDGVFTASQAESGRVLFHDVCIVCHPDPFWRSSWAGRPLGDLYTKVLKYMPDDNPGTLSPKEVTAALAYILQSNGAPAGAAPLPEDETALQRIRIATPAP